MQILQIDFAARNANGQLSNSWNEEMEKWKQVSQNRKRTLSIESNPGSS